MRAEESFDVGKRNGCSLIHNDQIRVSNLISVVGEDKLNKLSMSFEDIHSQHCSVVILVVAVYFVEVLPLLEVQQLKTNAYELEESLEVVWRRSSDEDIAVSELDCAGYGQTN